jgi:hypothetical protein
MHCYACENEAVGRCYNCGELFCDRHGKLNCDRCEAAIVAGDPRPDRISTQPLSRLNGQAWWRPQPAEDYQPPACYECGGLTRSACRNCGSLYCPEHGGKELCAACRSSSNMGMLALLGIVLLLCGILMFNLF